MTRPELPAAAPPAGAGALLQTRALTMRFGGVAALDGVDFELGRGELRCLIGPNGAGKSTFFRCISGQCAPSSGQVWIDGRQVTGQPMHAIARLGVGIKTQLPQLMNALAVRENLWLAARRRHKSGAAQERADAMLTRFGLDAIAGCAAGELAHGQRQMVELAMVLVCDPWLLLLDEPAGGLTQPEVERMAQAVRLASQCAAVIVVEHDMRFIRSIAAAVTVFHQGRILTQGSARDVLADERVKNVYLGRRPQ